MMIVMLLLLLIKFHGAPSSFFQVQVVGSFNYLIIFQRSSVHKKRPHQFMFLVFLLLLLPASILISISN